MEVNNNYKIIEKIKKDDRKSRNRYILTLLISLLLALLTLYMAAKFVLANKELKRVSGIIEKSNLELKKEKEKLVIFNDSIQDLNKRLKKQQIALDTAIDSIAKLAKKWPVSYSSQINEITHEARSDKFDKAMAYERNAFINIYDGKFDEAIGWLRKAEKSYPAFHQVYEIERYLNSNKTLFDSEKGKIQIFTTILEDFAWKAPKDILEKMKEYVNNKQ